jgi:uncharacterized membrane protein
MAHLAPGYYLLHPFYVGLVQSNILPSLDEILMRTMDEILMRTMLPGYSITFTLPVIVKALNFSTYESYLIPVPIYFGACAWTILNAHISDKRKRRGQHIILPFLLCILGLVFTFAGRARKTLVGLTMTGLV